MRLSHIEIRNWRSIQRVSFPVGRITALVGPNNAGKTSILCALNFLMGSKWPMARDLDDGDFFRRSRSDGMLVKVNFERTGDNLDSAWFQYAEEGKGDTGARVRYQPQGTAYQCNGDTRARFPLVYIDAERSFEKQFGLSRYTLFGQAIRHLEAHFESEVGEDTKRQLAGHLDAAQLVLRTPLYEKFVGAVRDAFAAQVRHTRHTVDLDFRAFDPMNFYRALAPFLSEDGERRSPGETGSGLRNLIVLALFRAYGEVFRGTSVVAIEEPEMYLHPHAQRGLMRMFREIADNGTQILYSTHSSAFVSVERFDEVVLVEKAEDPFEEHLSTEVTFLTAPDLVAAHRRNRPGEEFRIEGIRARYRHNCGPEHTEALFGCVVVLVEGATEAASLPLYADRLGMNLDALGISVVNARGKDSLESLYQLYRGLGRKVFVVFDNDVGKRARSAQDRESRKVSNRRLTRLLGLGEQEEPPATITDACALMDGDFEATVRAEVEAVSPGTYDAAVQEAAATYASASKPIAARHLAERLWELGIVPPTVVAILSKVAVLAGAKAPEWPPPAKRPSPPQPPPEDDDIPF